MFLLYERGDALAASQLRRAVTELAALRAEVAQLRSERCAMRTELEELRALRAQPQGDSREDACTKLTSAAPAPAPCVPRLALTPSASEQAEPPTCTPRVLPTATPRAALATPRSIGRLLAATPRGAELITPRSVAWPATRGTIAEVRWAGAAAVPWVAFVCRASGRRWLYGASCAGCSIPNHDEQTLCLRRGEYIRCIAGGHKAIEASKNDSGTESTLSASRPEPELAQWLRIISSEGQDVSLGDAPPDEELQASAARSECGFEHEAAPGHEIVGLVLGEDGAVAGVKQAKLAPSRTSVLTCGRPVFAAPPGDSGSTVKGSPGASKSAPIVRNIVARDATPPARHSSSMRIVEDDEEAVAHER